MFTIVQDTTAVLQNSTGRLRLLTASSDLLEVQECTIGQMEASNASYASLSVNVSMLTATELDIRVAILVYGDVGTAAHDTALETLEAAGNHSVVSCLSDYGGLVVLESRHVTTEWLPAASKASRATSCAAVPTSP